MKSTLLDRSGLKNLPSSIRETYAAHVILDAGGINMDDIYVVPSVISPVSGEEEVGVVGVCGDLKILLAVGPRGMTVDEFSKLWLKTIIMLNVAPAKIRRHVVDGTETRKRAVEIFSMMAVKGFSLKHKDILYN